jgi:hypothetical protein
MKHTDWPSQSTEQMAVPHPLRDTRWRLYSLGNVMLVPCSAAICQLPLLFGAHRKAGLVWARRHEAPTSASPQASATNGAELPWTVLVGASACMARTCSAASAKARIPRQRQSPAVAAEDNAANVAAQPPSALSLRCFGVRVHVAGSCLLAASAAFLQIEFTAPCMKIGVEDAMSDSKFHASPLASRHVLAALLSPTPIATKANHVQRFMMASERVYAKNKFRRRRRVCAFWF